MSQQVIEKIYRYRTDIARYLVHWTNQDEFCAIVRSGFFIAGKAPRPYDGIGPEMSPTVYGKDKVVCFSEMPVGNWLQSISANRRYSDRRWGIAVLKDVFYEYGARPVLYGDRSLLRRLKDEDKYLFVPFHPFSVPDWSHEREWRVRPNVEFNDRIGLKSQVVLTLGFKGEKRKARGNSLVPLYLSCVAPIRKSSPKRRLSGLPQFVFLVEKESFKTELKSKITHLKNSGALPYKLINEQYSLIAEYRDQYLEILNQVNIVSLEQVRDERDRLGHWCLENILESDSYLATKNMANDLLFELRDIALDS